MKQLVASDIMTRNPITVRETMSIGDVLVVLKSKAISGAPVVDEAGSLTGMVSLKDIAFDALFRGASGHDGDVGYRVMSGNTPHPVAAPSSLEIAANLTARDIMTPMVFTVPVDATLNEIADDMSKGRVHRLVVVDGESVVGIVSSLDLLKVIRTCE